MKKHSIVLCSFVLALACIYPSVRADAASVSAGSIFPSESVPTGTRITFQVDSSGFSSNPTYTISDSFPGSTISNSSISKFGYFNWTPGPDDIGTHTLTIVASDTYGNRSTLTKVLRVTEPSPVMVTNMSPGSSVLPGNRLSFSVVAQGYVNPSYYVWDSFAGTTLTSRSIDAYGNFGWTPTKADIGVHSLSVQVSSAGRSDSVYQTVTVNGVSIQNPSSKTVAVGSPLTFSIATYGMTSPSFRVTDSASGNSISLASINGTSFSWTPLARDIGTHTITVHATDIYGAISSSDLTVSVIAPGQISQPVTTVTPMTPVQPSQPTASGKYVFKLALNVGSKGAEVIELQKRLKAEGYFSGPVTGTYGPLTKTAVQKYQKAKKLQQLGNVGPGTRAALNK